MKFCDNWFGIQLKSKTLIKIIGLLSVVFNALNAQKILPLSSCNGFTRSKCNTPGTRCNKYLNLCECQTKFPIPLISINQCLDYRKLGEECVVSDQCQTDNSVCVTSEGKPIDLVDKKLVTEYFQLLRRNRGDKQNSGLGQCKCKKGFKQIAGKHCFRISLSKLTCLGAYECLEADLNSHCDKASKRCYCDPGYVYDNDRNQCTIITKKFGDICKKSYECQNWDQNMDCRSDYFGIGVDMQCLCKPRHSYDTKTQRCKLSADLYAQALNSPTDSKYRLCNPGFRWDEKSSECEREGWRYGVRKYGDFGLISLDKFLETIVIVIFCFVTIAFLRFWRYILPQNIVSESQTGMFSDFSHTNRVQRRRNSRSNSGSRRGRVIQLRVNLESPEPDTNETYVALPLTGSHSHSSLPTYESASLTVPMLDSHPPPYSEEPPTYEEAIKLFETTKL